MVHLPQMMMWKLVGEIRGLNPSKERTPRDLKDLRRPLTSVVTRTCCFVVN